jgi:hypothetical protein
MTPAEFATHVRFMTRTNSTTFTDDEILALMKVRQDELAKDIIDADEDILLIPQYTDLVADQREYPLPTDMVSSIKRVEAKLDGTNFIKLKELDIVSLEDTILDETTITSCFSNEEGGAFFDLSRKSLYLYSGTITDVSEGLKVWINTWLTAITDLSEDTDDMSIDPSTTTHGIPRELHEIWARGVIIDYKSSREKVIPLSEKELSYKIDKIEAINSLKPQNRDRTVSFAPEYNDGWQY